MKKMICFVLIIYSLFLCSCSSQTDDWKPINIKDCGTIMIPNNWMFFVEDDIMYITEDEKPIMISCKRTGENESNLYFEDYQYVDFISSAVLSNGPIYGKAKYQYSNNQIERYYLDLGERLNDGILVEFVVWDEGISEDLLIRIAKTFISAEANQK